jgi:hypothetical protein
MDETTATAPAAPTGDAPGVPDGDGVAPEAPAQPAAPAPEVPAAAEAPAAPPAPVQDLAPRVPGPGEIEINQKLPVRRTATGRVPLLETDQAVVEFARATDFRHRRGCPVSRDLSGRMEVSIGLKPADKESGEPARHIGVIRCVECGEDQPYELKETDT